MPLLTFTHDLGDGKHAFGELVLNRPQALNSTNLEMAELLSKQLLAWQHDDRIAFVVMRGEGERAFCAGGDIVSIYRSLTEQPDVAQNGDHYAYQFFRAEYSVNHLLHYYTKPVVALGQGVVMGGGVGLFMGASHRVVFPTTRYAMPEVGIGLFPDVAGTYLLGRLAGGVGEFLTLTGSSINAQDCGFLGLADWYIQDLDAKTIVEMLPSLLPADLGNPTLALNAALRGLSTPYQFEESAVWQNYEVLRKLANPVSVESFFQQAEDLVSQQKTPWFEQGLVLGSKGSMLSRTISLALVQQNRSKNIAQTLGRDLWVAIQCCAHGDFKEGVRALLIDKDKNPQWQPLVQDVRQYWQPAWESPALALSLPD